MYKLRLITSKTYPRLSTWIQFLRDLWPKQVYGQTGRRTINYRMVAILPLGKLGNQNLSHENIYIYERRNTCPKVMVEHLLTCMYICISSNFITFLSLNLIKYFTNILSLQTFKNISII